MLELKNDGMPGQTEKSVGDPATALFKMTLLTVMAGYWHKTAT
jgi:hypothetical protein